MVDWRQSPRFDAGGARVVGSHTRIIAKIRVARNTLTPMPDVCSNNGALAAEQALQTGKNKMVLKA